MLHSESPTSKLYSARWIRVVADGGQYVHSHLARPVPVAILSRVGTHVALNRSDVALIRSEVWLIRSDVSCNAVDAVSTLLLLALLLLLVRSSVAGRGGAAAVRGIRRSLGRSRGASTSFAVGEKLRTATSAVILSSACRF